jgi:hypothetical protein
MKIVLTFKTPDVISSTIESAIESGELPDNDGVEVEFVRQVCQKFVRWDEYVEIEIDTDKGTAKVLPVK